MNVVEDEIEAKAKAGVDARKEHNGLMQFEATVKMEAQHSRVSISNLPPSLHTFLFLISVCRDSLRL